MSDDRTLWLYPVDSLKAMEQMLGRVQAHPGKLFIITYAEGAPGLFMLSTTDEEETSE